MTHACKKILCGVALALAATPAFAHTGGVVSGFHSGFAHPMIGLDHLMAMAAVGVWSAAQPVKLAWRGPAVFLALLAGGGILGFNGVALPTVETGILASVVILGLMIAAARILPAGLSLLAIGAFALLHGHAHGSEAVGTLGGYMAGFLLASSALHGAGYAAGRWFAATRYGLITSGLAIAAGGLALAGA